MQAGTPRSYSQISQDCNMFGTNYYVVSVTVFALQGLAVRWRTYTPILFAGWA